MQGIKVTSSLRKVTSESLAVSKIEIGSRTCFYFRKSCQYLLDNECFLSYSMIQAIGAEKRAPNSRGKESKPQGRPAQGAQAQNTFTPGF